MDGDERDTLKFVESGGAYHEFPPDLFTHTQRTRGAVIIHIAVIIYMFYAVAVVCDDYFVASLEECCSVRTWVIALFKIF
ncbi:hypothetical protein NPIL_408731 [Nephila pilipes]|uniref:Uncharacterized protein n=1 Tax=Nephila pilipes TaxID=299642 RepID=A0A8X6TAF3_NEPPI|nr:hypothetical protein NPIL_408731 [Nephila pilipes]